jgi:hypothetical protein
MAAPARFALVFAAAVLLFLPTIGYDWVQDDRGVIVRNPAVQSLPAAVRALDEPYWPKPSLGGMYRPVTILTLATDWWISGGRPAWFHFANLLWHAVAAVLLALVVARWLPPLGAVAAGLLFAVHPVHVEGVASVVSRAELLVAVGMFAAILAARRGWWVAATLCALVAMFSKEHGVVIGAVILLDDWLRGRGADVKRYPAGFYAALGAATLVYAVLWWNIGRASGIDVAPAFYGVGSGGRLTTALPAMWRATALFAWPADLVADYNPQVIPVRSGFSLAALGGTAIVVAVPLLALWCRRRAPAVTLAAVVAMLAYLPTSNLLFASGVVLAERTLYLPVVLIAVLGGAGATWAVARWGPRRAGVGITLVVLALGLRSWMRLPIWKNNKSLVLTTLAEHPESYRAHVWAAAVLSGIGDTSGARAEYARAGELFDRDPHLDAARAYYLMELGDTIGAAPLIAKSRRVMPAESVALRARFLLLLRRGDRAGAQALSDTALAWSPWDASFYSAHRQ